MARLNRGEMQVGHWWAPCCLHDLQRVQDAEDIASILDDDIPMFAGGWDSCAEAVDDLIRDCDQEERRFLLDWYRGSGESSEIAREIERHIQMAHNAQANSAGACASPVEAEGRNES